MSCSVRLLNELPSGAASLLLADNSVVASAPAGGASPYAPVACDANLTLADASGARAAVPPAAADASVLAVTLAGAPHPIVFADSRAPLAAAPGAIDVASLRVINARAVSVALSGVASECYGCALPPLPGDAARLAPGAAATVSVSAKYGFEVGADGARVATGLALREHARATLVLHAAGGGASVLEDAAGEAAPYAPLGAAAGILLSAAALLWAARRAARAAGARAARAGAGAAPPPAARRAVTPVSFFALDTAFAAGAAAAAAEAAAAADADDDGGAGALLLGASLNGGDAEPRARKEAPARAERVLALDTFRGISLAIM